MKKTWELSRRTFLRGAGTLVALPLLEAMLPSVARAQGVGAASPRRLVVFYVPNGIHMAAWTPASEGAGYALTPILQPLAGLQSEVLVLSGLDNYAATAQGDGAGDHARGTGSFLTCQHVVKTSGDGIRNGISLDQVVANSLRAANATRFASLELGLDGGGATGDCDSGYSCAYARNIAWSGPQTPLGQETSPRALFDRLFAGHGADQSAAAIARRRLYRQSVLDFVQEDHARLAARLGVSDRRKLDEYATGVRELEVRLQTAPADRACEPGTRPASSDDVRQRLGQMLDLIALAFQCDQTRVVTFMLGNAGSGRVYDFLGISRGHHEISHHDGQAQNHAELTTIDTWEVEQFAALLGRLRTMREPDGSSLLDHTLALFSSEIEDGNSHRHGNLPVLLAGRGGGALSPGRHVRYADGTPIANLFVALQNAMGVPESTFGSDGTAPLAGLA